MSTERFDSGQDAEFRVFVRQNRKMGYGRMAQIVDEEWRRVDENCGGLMVVCGKCRELIMAIDGITRAEYRKFLAMRASQPPAETPAVLRAMSPEELVNFKPLSEETIAAAIAEGSRARWAAEHPTMPTSLCRYRTPGVGVQRNTCLSPLRAVCRCACHLAPTAEQR